MEFKVRNTAANLRNAKDEESRRTLEYKLNKSGKMIIINANNLNFPYLTRVSQWKKVLGF